MGSACSRNAVAPPTNPPTTKQPAGNDELTSNATQDSNQPPTTKEIAKQNSNTDLTDISKSKWIYTWMESFNDILLTMDPQLWTILLVNSSWTTHLGTTFKILSIKPLIASYRTLKIGSCSPILLEFYRERRRRQS